MGSFYQRRDDVERDRLQREVDRLERRIRRRLIGKFSAIAQSAYDVDDILASTRRRLDEAFVHQRIRADTSQELNAYVQKIAERIALDVVRKQKREDALRKAMFSQSCQLPVEQREVREMMTKIMAKSDCAEKALLEFWMRGWSERRIAEALDLSIQAYRSRRRRLWHLLRTELGTMK